MTTSGRRTSSSTRGTGAPVRSQARSRLQSADACGPSRDGAYVVVEATPADARTAANHRRSMAESASSWPAKPRQPDRGAYGSAGLGQGRGRSRRGDVRDCCPAIPRAPVGAPTQPISDRGSRYLSRQASSQSSRYRSCRPSGAWGVGRRLSAYRQPEALRCPRRRCAPDRAFVVNDRTRNR